MLLASAIEQVGKDETFMNYPVECKKFSVRKAYCLRDIIPRYEDEGILWRRLGEQVPDGTYQAVSVYFDEGYRESDVDVQVCMVSDAADPSIRFTVSLRRLKRRRQWCMAAMIKPQPPARRSAHGSKRTAVRSAAACSRSIMSAPRWIKILTIG